MSEYLKYKHWLEQSLEAISQRSSRRLTGMTRRLKTVFTVTLNLGLPGCAASSAPAPTG